MKFTRQAGAVLAAFLLFLLASPASTAQASGTGNMDGGGGNFGTGTDQNKWLNGDEGVRVTIVNAADGSPASSSIDISNANPGDIVVHFTKTCKSAYRAGASLAPSGGPYTCIRPGQSLPNIITTQDSGNNIEQIKRYFTDEQVLRGICGYCGFDFDTLVEGGYKVMIEPLAFVTFQGLRTAMTATEAALYDRLLGGKMRSLMPSLSHKNLPLAIFLETSDLGFPAWGGSRTTAASNDDIISALGIGIVRFDEAVTPIVADYEYRVDTDVITAVTVSGGQADPDRPVEVKFLINGTSYTVNNVYYPSGASQLVWVKWHTPSTPQMVDITVTVRGGGTPGRNSLTARIVDLDGNDPPNPTANDRNDSYSPARAVMPTNPEKTSAAWSVWTVRWHENWVWHSDWRWRGEGCREDCPEGCEAVHGRWIDEGEWEDDGWWDFGRNGYTASLTASMSLAPDSISPTASPTSLKSGYGVNISVDSSTSSNQHSAVTGSQTAVSYFPEFYYKSFWRLLERTSGGLNASYQFKANQYSTLGRRTHFTPVWMKDGNYTVYTYLLDCWTPDGMLSTNLSDSVGISGNLWMDWHIAPRK